MKWRYLLLAVVVLAQLPLIHQACWTASPGAESIPFADDFDRDTIGPDYHWFFKASRPHLEGGRLVTGKVMNNPIWLDATLPADVRITFDVQASARVGDLKWECFGNGRDHESGYIFIFGGWNNSISVLARRDEHGTDRKERRDMKVDPARVYRMRIERQNGDLKWFVDSVLFLEWNDEHPLEGKGHDRFAFSAWETPGYYDNLRIEAL